MTTFSGRRFYFDNPTPDMVSVQDIGHHLSMICGWGGAARCHFSVAQHSVLVSQLCPPKIALWALLHDAAEAYFGDMVKPLKLLLPEYKILETRALRVIAEKFGLSWPAPPDLKQYDVIAQAMASRDFMHGNEQLFDDRGETVQVGDLPQERLIAWSQPLAEVRFLVRFHALWDGAGVESGGAV